MMPLRHTWNEGPYAVGMILSPFFAIGSNLIDSSHEAWCNMCELTLEGQFLAVTTHSILYRDDKKRLSDEDWNKLLLASGM